MSLILPRAPSPDRLRSDPDGYARDVSNCIAQMTQELERMSRAAETPTKAAFLVTNIAAPTTTLDGGTAILADVVNFLGGLCATLLAKGIIRTKVGPQ